MTRSGIVLTATVALAGALAPTPPVDAQSCPFELAKLQASDGAPGDFFGTSVAARGSRLLVGAWGGDNLGLDSGEAYLFDAATGQQTAKLIPEDSAWGDQFGVAVALGDSVAVVGAWHDDDFGPKSGAAYLFDVATGQQTAKLLPNDGEAGDRFGSSVAISGTTVVVGALLDGHLGTPSGSAYLFDTTTGQQTAKLFPADGAWGDWFGVRVAVSGSTVLIGAPLDDDAGGDSGSVYVFDGSSGQQTAKLLPGDGAAGDRFGSSVAISRSTAIVGAPDDDDFGTSSGSVYLFDTTTGQEIAKLSPRDAAPFDAFGTAVAAERATVVVGAYRNDDAGSESGSAYLFDAPTGLQVAKLLPADGAGGDNFGCSVSVGDGKVVVGAPGDGPSAGSANLFAVPAAPAAFCTAKTNSLGCSPSVHAAGVVGFSEPRPFLITARDVVSRRPGLFFYGTGGRANAPFLGGTLCALPPLQRTRVQASGGNPGGGDCSGVYEFDFNAWIASGWDPDLAPGIRVDGQFWSRDPDHPDGTGVGLTDAIELVLCP